MRKIFLAVLTIWLFTQPADAKGFKWFFKHVHPTHACHDYKEVVASFYWEGRRTATGARFNPNGLTAAHRTLPFGTRVSVRNPKNGRSATVTINDRGPYVKGVSIDLARGAARRIGMNGTQYICMKAG